jgi:cysteine desulfurase/selenocysteine lyase
MSVLWARQELLAEMTPHQFGGGAAEEATPKRHKFKNPPENFEAGTGDPASALGLAAAIESLNDIGMSAIWRYEQTLTEHALERLGELEQLELIGSREAWERIPLFTFTYKGLDGETIARRLNERGIAITGSNLHAQPLLARFGLETAARASCWIYNTVDEIDRFVEALEDLRA